RYFLELIHKRFFDYLTTPVQPMTLTSITPSEVVAGEPGTFLIKGEHLPTEVVVTFNDHHLPTPPTCKPQAGEITLTTPPLAAGKVVVRVCEKGNEKTAGSLDVNVVPSPPPPPPPPKLPIPLCQFVDRDRLRAARLKSGLTQLQVAQRVGESQNGIS